MNNYYKKLSEFFYSHNREYSIAELLKKMKVESHNILDFIDSLYKLECDGKVYYKTTTDNYISTHFPNFPYRCGVLQISNRNHAYVSLNDKRKVILSIDDVRKHGGHVGDYVYVDLEPTAHPKCMRGHIKSVIGKPEIPLIKNFTMEATIKKNILKDYYYVLKNNIEIPLTELNGAFIRDKALVSVKLTNKGYVGKVEKTLDQIRDERVFILEDDGWKSFENPDCKVILDVPNNTYEVGTRVLAKYVYDKDNNYYVITPVKIIAKTNMDEDIVSLAEEYGFSLDFLEDTKKEMSNIIIPRRPFIKRMDLRGLPTYTIDPIYAKDLDDAISLEKLNGGGYRLYVHIADVSFYVKYDSAIMKEALKRGTSCYLSHFVFPMLPSELSDNLCSLNPGENKFAKTFEMTLDEEGNVIDYRAYDSIIKSGKKYDYGTVNQFLERGILTNDIMPNIESLLLMKELSDLLEKKKKARGALEFANKEVKFVYGVDGSAVHVEEEQRGLANKLIENFMLLANESTAKYAQELDLPFIYRNHEPPTKEALFRLKNVLKSYKGNVKNINAFTQTKNMQKFMTTFTENYSDEELQHIANIFLCSLSRARYDARSYGHYGLNYKTYATVTSPIRRFADLANHMSISEYQKNGMYSDTMKRIREMVNEVCDYISERQKIEDELERDVNYLLLQNYASNFYGETIEATVEFVGEDRIIAKTFNNIPGTIYIKKARYIPEQRAIFYNDRIYRHGDKIEIQIVNSKHKMKGIEFLLKEKVLERKKKNDKH